MEDYDVSGGPITITWDTMVACGNVISHTLLVTVMPLSSSTQEITGDQFQIYPNPCRPAERIAIRTANNLSFHVKILDSAGKIATQSSHTNSIQAPAQSGLYNMILTDSKGFKYISRLVVN